MSARRNLDIIGVRFKSEREDLGDSVEWHIANFTGADYTTVCGVDAYDPSIGHHGTADATAHTKVTCSQCHALWKGFRELKLRSSDFKGGI